MPTLNNQDFDRYLIDTYEKATYYEARFPKEHFEIAFLVSRTACGMLYSMNEPFHRITEDPFECHSYLFGHRVAFVNANYIPSYDGETFLIQPVIVCKNINHFPLEAEVGDYVFYNGFLKQVKYIDYIGGDRAIGVADIDIELSDNFHMSEIDRDQFYCGVFREVKAKNKKKDAWTNKVDNKEINDYLASLTIT